VGDKNHLASKISFGLFLAVLLVYILTLHPFFSLGDSGEFIVVAKTGGIAHPPGFPLYTLISNLIASINIGSLVTRLNFLSAIFGALSVTVVYLLIYKLTKDYLASLMAALILAFSHLFWLFSIITEVYTLSILLNVLAIYLFVSWTRKEDTKLLYLLAFIGGLSLSVHYVNLFTLILIALFSIPNIDRKFFKIKNFFILACSFLLGLAPVFSILIAAKNNTFINWGNIEDFSGFLRFIKRSDYQGVGLGETLNPLSISFQEQIPFLAKAIYNSFGLLAFLLLPAFWVKRKQFRFPLLILTNFIVLGPLLVIFLNYSLSSPYPDVAQNHKRLMQQFHILSFPYVGILAGLGANNILNRTRKSKNKLLYWTFITSIFGFLVFIIFVNYQKIASARNFIYKSYGENILNNIEKPTILITGTEESNILNYLYAVEGKKKNDVKLITFSLMQHKWYVEHLKERYPDVYFPFESVVVGVKLDEFYQENLNKFDIIFAPLDDQASESVSQKFSFISYGVIVELVYKENEPDLNSYIAKNNKIFQELLGKEDFIDKSYYDEATNEVLMSYARAFTNIALKSKNLGDNDTALNFLDNAVKTQPAYYKAHETAASIYLDGNDLSNALKEYRDILEIDPGHKLSLRNLALIYDLLGNKVFAQEYAIKYLEAVSTQAEKQEALEILRQIGN